MVEGAGAALLRGGCVALVATGAAACLRPALLALGHRARMAAWALLLAPYLVPAILIGYVYAPLALIAMDTNWVECLYDALLLLRFIPLAALILCLVPGPCSPEAKFCHRLTAAGKNVRRRSVSAIGFWLRSDGRVFAIAFASVFLFVFADFELATLLNVKTWTITLFDAQKGGLLITESLRLALAPVLYEGLLLLAVIVLLFRSRGSALAGQGRASESIASWQKAALWIYLNLAAGAMIVVPGAVILKGAAQGFWLAAANPVVARDILAGLLFAAATALVAYLVAGWFAESDLAFTRIGALALSIPGLFGGLVLALVIQFLFQRRALNWAYDTPIPAVIALVALVLPFAMLLRILLRAFRRGESLHSATLLRASDSASVRRAASSLLWRMKTGRLFWAAFLLFYLAYFELTASAILAPTGMTPVVVRLYNEMHYGQSAVLSAMVSIAFAVPLLAGLAVLLIVRFLSGVRRAA